MIYSANKEPKVLASKLVANGRWGDHTVEVCEQDGRFLYCNGWSDPLETTREEAFRYFEENIGRLAA